MSKLFVVFVFFNHRYMRGRKKVSVAAQLKEMFTCAEESGFHWIDTRVKKKTKKKTSYCDPDVDDV